MRQRKRKTVVILKDAAWAHGTTQCHVMKLVAKQAIFSNFNPALLYQEIESEVWAAHMPTYHSLVVSYLEDTHCIVRVDETLRQEVGGGKKLLLCAHKSLMTTCC